MTRPVIAGVDGSERGVDAARFAAEALTAQLLVVGHRAGCPVAVVLLPPGERS
jgi:hypothetical protein